MNSENPHTESPYFDVWRRIAKHILNWTDEQFGNWMDEVGTELLRDKSVVHHEESWYWMIPAIVGELMESPSEVAGKRNAETRVFFVLRDVFKGEKILLEDARDECKRAINGLG